MLNLPVQPGDESPEPDICCVLIDGIPIYNVVALSLQGGNQYTCFTVSFYAEIGGLSAKIPSKVN